jgi:hypothetical protein
MTSRRLRNSLIAVLAFVVAAALIVASAFAADGDGGKNKRRGNTAKLNSGTFQIVVPKADRGGSSGNVAKFVAPKADRGGRQVAKFVAPKADRGNSSGPKTIFSLPPKAPRTGTTTAQIVAPKAPRGSDGPTVAKFVAPKAPRGNGPVIVAAAQPKLAAPQLLAPPSAPTPVKVEQAVSAPAPVETKAAPVGVASEAPAAPATAASDREIELAYTRAAERYGYGDDDGGYETYDEGYGDTYTGGSYGDDGCY